MQTICIASHKGGAGKTVSTLAIAARFARTGSRVLVADLDPQGLATLGFDVKVDPKKPNAFPTLTHCLKYGDPAMPIPSPTTPGVAVLAADLTLEPVADKFGSQAKREQWLDELLEPLDPTFDLCVCDCPPRLGVLVEGAIARADLVLIPCEMSDASIELAVAGVLGCLDDVRNDTKSKKKGKPVLWPDFDDWRIVMTRVLAHKTKQNRAALDALQDHHARILEPYIPECVELNNARRERTDVFKWAGRSTGAEAYATLVENLRPLLSVAPELTPA